MEPIFNRAGVARSLSALQSGLQTAVGAGCCERMLPNFRAFVCETKWGDVSPLRLALDYAWDVGGGRDADSGILRQLLERCEACVPVSDEFRSEIVSYAQDAALAVCGLIDFLLAGEVDALVGVLSYSIDSVDCFVQELEGMSPQDRDLERKILRHPLMQQELLRQRRDLDDALAASGVVREFVQKVRSRAQSESNLALE